MKNRTVIIMKNNKLIFLVFKKGLEIFSLSLSLLQSTNPKI